jgi:protein disulfide-isomerase
MRIASLTLFLGASALVAAQATDAKLQDDFTTKSTYFDGKKVPPLLELTLTNIDNEFNRTKYMVVKYGR